MRPLASTPSSLAVIAAFAVIYVVWGSTYLAIRIAVREVPPLLAAGIRFFTAGVLLYAFAQLRKETPPSRRQWRNLSVVSLCLFVVTYGALFWAEKSVPSGVASVLAATVPLSTMLLEVFVFHHQRFSRSLLFTALVGFAGVSLLMWQPGSQAASPLPALGVLVGATAWSLGSVISKSVELPASKFVTSGAEMLLGGVGLLAWSGLAGEWSSFHHIPLRAAWALLYLITVGSLLGFTAFVWLLAHMSASRVSSYAYVNPVVAVLLGYFFANETISFRTLLATTLVLGSVTITLLRK